MSTSHSSVSMESRRRNGIFYTPDMLAHKMAQWAITTPRAKVMDPSFGGCAFLRAAVHQLRKLRAPHPAHQVYGVDRDSSARTWLESVLHDGAREHQFFFGDFLTLRPAHFQTLFTAVLGNPPYVKHHSLSARRQQVAARALLQSDYRLSALASYWAYFVLHAIDFVAPGGRLALVLPGSLIHADYARTVREALQNAFGRVTALFLRERMFADAEEESVLVFAERRAERSREVRVGIGSCTSLRFDAEDLEQATRSLDATEAEDSWLRAVLDSRILSVYDRAATQCDRLADKAGIRIGAVTGANRFFVLRPSAFRALSLRRAYARPIVSRAAFVRGLVFDNTALKNMREKDAACLLLCPPLQGSGNRALRSYLRKGTQERLPERTKCALRDPWYRVQTGRVPDAFLTYMTGVSPRLVLNEARIPCTNAIHALTWHPSVSDTEARRIALGFLSTVTRFSAEVEGRSYGGGVLKLEPSEAGRLVIPKMFGNHINRLFREAHELSRCGKADDASQLVDDLLLGSLFTAEDLSTLRVGLEMLRARRLSRTLFPLGDAEDASAASEQRMMPRGASGFDGEELDLHLIMVNSLP